MSSPVMPIFRRQDVSSLIHKSLQEDLGSIYPVVSRRDITSETIVSPKQKIEAVIRVRQAGVVAGVELATWIFQELDRRIECTIICPDGKAVQEGEVVIKLQGPARSILSAERTALNFLGHLSGIATLTHQFVTRVSPYPVSVLDTRKTLPGLRMLQKFAVRMGGGKNHRSNLTYAILIKSNHLKAEKISVAEALKRARRKLHGSRIQTEVQTFSEFKAALLARPRVIMLDNWRLLAIRKAVKLRRGKTPLLEVSGGVTLANVRAIAKTGVDRISIGRLTHSAPSLDVSLEVG